MARLMGALLLMGGGLYLGLGRAAGLARRCAALNAWCAALAHWEGELAFRLPAMPELLQSLSVKSASPAREVLAAVRKGMGDLGEQSFSAIWARAVDEHSEALAPADRELLCRLGDLPGRCGWEDQRRGVETLRQSLQAQEARLRSDLAREGKVYGTLGLSAGALLTILLL